MGLGVGGEVPIFLGIEVKSLQPILARPNYSYLLHGMG